MYEVSQMNPTLEYIYNHPKETKRIIGITYEQLIKLIAKAQIIESEKKEAIAKTEKRLIKAGGGRKKNLTKEEEIILTLFYLHQIPTFQTLGINFGISESSANNIFHYWIDILRELLPASLLEQVKKKENWSQVLSVGEQQRVAFTRLLLTQPKYVILDEATSALDVPTEEILYKQLQETSITFISVGHRPTLKKYHQQLLEITANESWQLKPIITLDKR